MPASLAVLLLPASQCILGKSSEIQQRKGEAPRVCSPQGLPTFPHSYPRVSTVLHAHTHHNHPMPRFIHKNQKHPPSLPASVSFVLFYRYLL